MGRMTTRRKVSPREVERRLIADAENPDAWEFIATVGPSRSSKPSWYRGGTGNPPSQHSAGTPARRSRQPVVQNNNTKASRLAIASRDHAETEVLLRKQLHDAIAELPKTQRQILQLWFDGFQYREISDALAITLTAVKSQLRDAKSNLRSRLEGAAHDFAASGHHN
jgi:RNA polymerase sigma factor (sigma-70 family)